MAKNTAISMTDLRLLMRVSILCGGDADFVTGGVAEIQSVPLLPTLQYKSTPGKAGSPARLSVALPQVQHTVVREQLGELLTTSQIDALINGAGLTVKPAQSADSQWASNSDGTTKYDMAAGGQYAVYDGPNVWANQPLQERVFIFGASAGKYRQNGPLTIPIAHNMLGGEVRCDVIRVYDLQDYAYPSGLVPVNSLPITDVQLLQDRLILRDFERYYYFTPSYRDMFGVNTGDTHGTIRIMLTKFMDASADWAIVLHSDGTTWLGSKSDTTYSAVNLSGFNDSQLWITPTAPITCSKIRVNIQRSSVETAYALDATTVLRLNTPGNTHDVTARVNHAAKLYGLDFDITLTLPTPYTLTPGDDKLELILYSPSGQAAPSGSITSIEYLP